MKNKIAFTFSMLIIFLALIIIIGQNRAKRKDNELKEEKQRKIEQLKQDSIKYERDKIINEQIIQANKQAEIEKARANKQAEIEKARAIEQAEIELSRAKEQAEIEFYNSLINSKSTNKNEIIDIAVTVIDENKNVDYSITTSIAKIYNDNKFNVRTNLLSESLFKMTEFEHLYAGNSELISKLDLQKYTDYLALGKIKNYITSGDLAKGTFICTTSLIMNIISVDQKTVIKSFVVNAIGNGTSESQAKDLAKNQLINKYIEDYSSL